MPGRKTDVKDSEWIADLLKDGLLKGSYIPSREQRELKELVRYRRSMIDERARELNRLQKVLEGANIKLGSVVSDINGVSARQMLMSMIQGNEDVDRLVLFAKRKMKEKTDDLKRSLKGLMGRQQRMILSRMMEHINYLDGLIESLDEEIKERMRPFEDKVVALDAITGVGERSAQTIIAEIVTDMSTFPSARHLASWAGMCPGNNESAGKKKSGKTRKGNNTLRCTLVECAKAAGRSKNTYFSEQYKRLAARRGRNRAAVAVGHSILTIAYYILKDNKPFYDLGADYFEKKKKQDIARRALKRLEALGYNVTIEEQVSA